MLKYDFCVYWPILKLDGHGKPTFDEPQQVQCRWDEVQELFTDGDGEQVLSNAIVYVAVDMPMLITGANTSQGGFLYHGTEISLDSDHDDPLQIPGTKRIRRFSKIPKLRHNEFLRMCHL